MALSIAHLGPPGTYAEAAALAYVQWLRSKGQQALLCPCPSIAQTLYSVAQGQADLAVVPVENLIEGSVVMTLDTLWRLEGIKIQQALVLPIEHTLLSHAPRVESIQTIYSHPQAIAQCQKWLEQFLPQCQLIPMNSNTEALQQLAQETTAGAIASRRAAELYNIPILATSISDYPDNCTRFWVVGRMDNPSGGTYTSLAFSVPANVPGALVKLLQVFASRGINLSRIESRPTKRSLGEYLFFMDLEADVNQPLVQAALTELATFTEVLKIWGSYSILPIQSSKLNSAHL